MDAANVIFNYTRTHDIAETRRVLDCDMSRAYYRGYGNNVGHLLKNRRAGLYESRDRWKLWAYEKCEREHFCVRLLLLLLAFPSTRTRQIRVRAPHRMNNWNNAGRKRGTVSWRSRNIDRKITIGLKTAVACLGGRGAKDRTRSTDVDRDEVLHLGPEGFLSPFLRLFSDKMYFGQ